MKRLLLVSIVLVLSLSCWHFKDYDVDLSTPENTLVSYYEGFRKSDFEYPKKTMETSIAPGARKRFDLLKPAFRLAMVLVIIFFNSGDLK